MYQTQTAAADFRGGLSARPTFLRAHKCKFKNLQRMFVPKLAIQFPSMGCTAKNTCKRNFRNAAAKRISLQSTTTKA